MNNFQRSRASHMPGRPLTDRAKQAGRIARVHPVYSEWQVEPITHYDRVSFVSAPSDYAVPFCRAFAVAAASGASFGSVSMPCPVRVLICTANDQRSVSDDLAAITTARGWLPKSPVAVFQLVFHWGTLDDGGELARIVKATVPELIVVEAGAPALPVVRSRFGDSDAAIIVPIDDPGNDPECIRLRIEKHDDKYQLTGDDGVILKMDRDDAGFIPRGRASAVNLKRLSAAKKTAVVNDAESTNDSD